MNAQIRLNEKKSRTSYLSHNSHPTYVVNQFTEQTFPFP